MPARDDPHELICAALAGRRAWLVGGAVRDRLLRGDAAGRGREAGATLAGGPVGHEPGAAPPADLDVVLDGDPGEAARALRGAAARAWPGGAAAFPLSEEHGGWRVVARDGAWQVDVERLRGATLAEDLALRDFTVNALAEPLGEPGGAPGEPIDPTGGLEDLARRRLRATGPRTFTDDPLRVLRLARLAVELDFEPEPATLAQARAHAPRLRAVAGERVFAEACRILDCARAVEGVELMGALGATEAVLPELHAARGVEQSHYHHLDVYGHTLEVLAQVVALQRDPAAQLGAAGAGGPAVGPGSAAVWPGSGTAAVVPAFLGEPLADGLTRDTALRWGALLHDLAKPLTRAVVSDPRAPGGERVTFIGHDELGARLAEQTLDRLRASRRLRAHVTALVRHHLRLGFLVHEPQPLARRTVFAYLRACEPVEVDVTLLSVADRLATLGARAQESIDAHLRLARAMLDDALRWRTGGAPAPLWRGDELARELGIPLGPRVGELLEELAAARYAGEVDTAAQALAHARAVVGAGGGVSSAGGAPPAGGAPSVRGVASSGDVAPAGG